MNPWEWLERAPNPLEPGLAFAAALVSSPADRTFLLELLKRFGDACPAAALQRLDELAGSADDAADLLRAVEPIPSRAATWLAGALLERLERPADAAARLQSIHGLAAAGPAGKDVRTLQALAVARNRHAAGQRDLALEALREAARQAATHRSLTAVDRLLRQLKQQGAIPARRKARVAIIGSVALEFAAPALRAACFATGIDVDLYVGGFNQFRQEILDPASALAAFRPEVIFLAVDWRGLGLPEEVGDPAAIAVEKVGEFAALWRECHERLRAFVVQHNFATPVETPLGRLSASLAGGRGRVLRRINLELWEAAQRQPGVAVLDVDQVAAAFGKTAWEDPVLWLAAKQYPAAAALPLLARHQAATLRALLGLASKCLVLDLDGLLWGGVIGEDGLNGIVLGGTPAGEAFVAFQHYALGLRRRGIPLAVCSKNNPADARQPFMEHPEMVLKLEDIAVFAANWNNKEDNLREIAATLNLGLESLVFLDDNPMERARVRRALPDVEVPELPAEPALYVRALDELLLFEALDLTDEDRQRAAAYRQNAERQELHASSGNLADFLANLEMSVELQPFDAANLPRIVQLINKTNQFNLTTVRMTEAEVNALVGRPDCYLQAMRLRDRFGDNGLTGVLIGIEENDTLRIHNWLISCRVLGRRVEEVMLSAAIRHSRERGMRWVRGEFRPTAKNAQVRDVYDRMGFELLEERSDGARFYRWDAQGELPAHECFRVDDRTVVVLAERNHG